MTKFRTICASDRWWFAHIERISKA